MRQGRRKISSLFVAVMLCALFLLWGCKDSKITEGYNQQYSKKEIELMMQYHGSLVARFDGKQWWCLQGRKWIKIDSANAAKFARLKLAKNNHNL